MNITSLLLKFVFGGGVLAMIYRLYIAITEHHEAAVETKDNNTVTADKQKDQADETKIAKDDAALNDAIAKFESDDK